MNPPTVEGFAGLVFFAGGGESGVFGMVLIDAAEDGGQVLPALEEVVSSLEIDRGADGDRNGNEAGEGQSFGFGGHCRLINKRGKWASGLKRT
jgi:hypothetical protein